MDILLGLRKQNEIADTELKNIPLYCPKCRQESLIDVKDLQVTPKRDN